MQLHRGMLNGRRVRRGGVIVAVAAACAVVMVAVACRRSRAEERSGRTTIVCTTGMVADIARNICGKHATVIALMGPGVDPHLYKVTPRDVRLLDRADIVLYSGLMLEGTMTDIFVKLARQRPVIAVADGIDMTRLRAPPGPGAHHDPHVWFDVSLWMQGAAHVRDKLCALDAKHAAAYRANAEAYLSRLTALHDYAATKIATIPAPRRVLVTAHDAFGYFGRAYGVEVRGVQGISTESEAGVKDINDLIEFLVARRVKAVFVETSVSERNVRALVEGCASRGHDVRIGGRLYSDAMGPPHTLEGSYIGMVKHNVDTIVEALK
ncbi:MAG: metal ABC transporter solute-binding protein, Zn/Mn family [Phycisphaerae bacterium]